MWTGTGYVTKAAFSHVGASWGCAVGSLEQAQTSSSCLSVDLNEYLRVRRRLFVGYTRAQPGIYVYFFCSWEFVLSGFSTNDPAAKVGL